MVDVKLLIRSIGRLAWKHGTHERVEHVVDADGNHAITIRVPKLLAEWEPPQALTSPTTFREHPELTWDEVKPPPRTPIKSHR
jgi:hypothetical protein